MEKRINKRLETYITSFKDDIKKKITAIQFTDKSKTNELLEYIYDYERLVISKDDMTKRKRVKNAIPDMNRCKAKRANGEQCTRRKKEDCEFCGTHSKGTPHGLVVPTENTLKPLQKIEVSAEEIGGIVYYIDAFNNVYKTEDIMQEKKNPEIIAKYVNTNGVYSIPQFGI